MLLDVTGMDRAWILMRLYNAARPLGFGNLHYSERPMTIDEARAILGERDKLRWVNERERYYFDYLRGRPLKLHLHENPLDVALYERDQDPGTAATALGMTVDP